MRRLDVDDPITKSVVGARAPVVDLVWIEHDHLPGGAGSRRPSIVEYLYSAVGQANGICVVAMLRIRHAGEPRAKELNAANRSRARNPVGGRPAARSFKTLAARSGYLKADALTSLREVRGDVSVGRR